MSRTCKTALALAAAVGGISIGTATPAAAQATRTWISGVGDDANPCSRTAPCRTFAGTISKTAAGGEINCIDPGAGGAVTIVKSISIICDITEAGVLATGGANAIIVNAGANDVVVLSGLDIFGVGSGGNGVRFLAGGTLHIRNSRIGGFAATNGNGVQFVPSGTSTLTITNSTINNNGTGNGSGVLVAPTGAGSARVSIRGTVIQNNGGAAVKADVGTSTGAGITLAIEDSELSGSTVGLTAVSPAGAGAPVASVSINASSVLGNTYGFIANGGTSEIRVSDVTLTNNSNGLLAVAGGAVRSYGNNRTVGNGGGPVTFTAPALPLN